MIPSPAGPFPRDHIAQAMSSYDPQFDNPGINSLDLEIARDCAAYHYDPYAWVLWAFDWGHGELEGFDGPDDWQRDLLIEWGETMKLNRFDGVTPVPSFDKVVSSGHGIGKSALVSWIILFIMSTRSKARGTVTANTATQLRTKTWAELSKWKSRCITGRWFNINSGGGALSMYHRAWPETWRTDAFTCEANNSEAFAGLHNAQSSPFYIFDEASNVPDIIWQVAEGGKTDGEPFHFAFGNPTRNTGEFADKLKPGSGWRPTQVDSRTAKMTNKAKIAEWLEKHGEDSDFFRVRVRGVLPRAGDMQFIPGDVVSEAMHRSPGRYTGLDPLICGIDVARGGGDRLVVRFRRGYDAMSEPTYIMPGEKTRDSEVVVSKLAMVLDRHDPDYTFIDATGIGGPIGDRLRALGFNVIDIHFGGKPDDDRQYADKTSEMGFRCREWLMQGGALKYDAQLEQELIAREYWHDKNGRLVVEPKGGGKGDRKGPGGSSYDGFKARMGYSPDDSDALYLTFALKVPMLNVPRGQRDVAPQARYSAVSRSRDYNPLDNV
jgi:hypothetical protein